MKKLVLLSLFTLLVFNISAYAANLYFYGGDWEPNDPNASEIPNGTTEIYVGDPYGAAVYQNFVASAAINVSGLFTNNASDYLATSGYWEIRSGVSFRNGGTLIASGTGNVTNDPTGRSCCGGYIEYTNAVSGLNVGLSAGTYWFAVVPTCTTCLGQSGNTNSLHGLNAVGTQISDQQYWTSAQFGANFENTDSFGVFPTFSSGVYADVVPEPSSIVMLGTGLLAAAAAVCRRLF